MKIIILSAGMLLSTVGFAQKDTLSIQKNDTIKIGNLVIVSDHKNESEKEHTIVNLTVDAKSKKRKNKEDISIRIGNDTLVAVINDTVKVGSINIVNKNEEDHSNSWGSYANGDFKKTKISFGNTSKKTQNFSTNWLIFDWGFTNLIDNTAPQAGLPSNPPPNQTTLPAVPNSTNLRLNNAKSSNVNIWIVQQKANIYKHYLSVKYGIGIEMYNFRFEQPISFRNTPGSYLYFDNVNFSKNKLFVEYLTIPLQLNYQSNPDNKRSFYAGIGVNAGYLLQAHTKQISTERGKQKVYGDFNLNNFKAAAIGELGVGSVRLYGSYSLTNLFDKSLTNFDMAPFAIGVRFSRF